MKNYLCWNEKKVSSLDDNTITSLYNEGYVFTRLGKGVMHQIRSLRVDLSKFELTSENRRILRKTDGLQLTAYSLPLTDYHWSIGKMAKNFYDTKFGSGTMSANKVKELLTDPQRSNFNTLLTYVIPSKARDDGIGYAVCYANDQIIHYAYPFYNLTPNTYNLTPNIGLGIMLRAILYAQEQGKRYIYLGSARRPSDVYKLQFSGLEWFDGKEWQNDIALLKKQLQQS